jgi:hypothetical protein
VVLGRFSLSGQRSAVTVEEKLGWVLTPEEGKIKRTEVFPTWQEALDAVGLRG